jgi:hypothetical protein
MADVSTLRLYVLRAAYLFAALGQFAVFWPGLLDHSADWALRNGDTSAMLCGLAPLMALGVRYPLRMLPLLLFELTWKALWLVAIYLPLARAGQVDDATRESRFAVVLGIVVCVIAIPWGHVWRRYVVEPGDRWRGTS